MKRFILTLTAYLLLTVHVHAASVCLISQDAIVAQPGKLSELIALARAKELEAMVMAASCLPKAGTKVVIIDRGWTSHTIRVLNGEWAGCVGDIPMEFVGHCQ